jgi:hypothetical protein
MEKTMKSLELRLSSMTDNTRKDDVITFEQLGIDRLFVDESHHYKDICYRGSFGNDTLLYSATALFAVHSEDCDKEGRAESALHSHWVYRPKRAIKQLSKKQGRRTLRKVTAAPNPQPPKRLAFIL